MGVVAPTRIPFWCSVIAAGGGACSNSVVRRIRYVVAMSLDGYIAGPKGEADWIIMDPGFDFGAMFRQFDTALIGRRTFEGMVRAGSAAMPGMKTLVFSRTLRQRDYPECLVVRRRRALSQPPTCKTRRHDRGRHHAGAFGRRDSAASSAVGSGKVEAGQPQDLQDGDRVVRV